MLARSLAEEYPGTLLLDLVVTVGGRRHAIEANCSPTPKPTRNYWQALNDLKVERAWMVTPMESECLPGNRMEVVMPAHRLGEIVWELGQG